MIQNGADIQVEGGNWAKVHNGILERLALTKLDGREARCLFFLLRMTYGRQTKHHEISLSLWTEGTGIAKRHVKPLLDKLIQRRIIYRIEGSRGRGHTATYGFNKYFEQWDSAEKVPSTVPFEKVPPAVPFVEEKVPSTVPEKVPSTVPTIERSSNKLPAAVDDEDGDAATALVRLAYQAICRFVPSQFSDEGKANLKVALELIDTYGFDTCVQAISTLKERNNNMIRRNARKGVRAPLPYLKTLMEDEYDAAPPAPAVVSFALEEIAL